jgi:hypothetical protein
MTDQRVVDNWIEATDAAIDALEEWRRKLRQWRQTGCDRGVFHAALFDLRGAGLEDWADRNEADPDMLAYAVTCLGSGSDEEN